MDPGPLEKVHLMSKLSVKVEESVLMNLSVLISTMALGFTNSSPKIPNQTILVLHFRMLILVKNGAL